MMGFFYAPGPRRAQFAGATLWARAGGHLCTPAHAAGYRFVKRACAAARCAPVRQGGAWGQQK